MMREFAVMWRGPDTGPGKPPGALIDIGLGIRAGTVGRVAHDTDIIVTTAGPAWQPQETLAISQPVGEVLPDALRLAVSPRLTEGRGHVGRGRHGLALAIAALLHAGLIALLVPGATDLVGDDGTTLEAITVSVVSSLPVAVAASAAAAQTAAPSEMSTERELHAEPEQAEAAPSQPPPSEAPPVALSLPPEPEVTTDAPALPQKREETKVVEPREDTTSPTEPTVAEAQPSSPAEPVAPSSPPPVAAAAEAAEASAGVVDAYVRRVSRALAARPPRPAGLEGRLLVSFVIDADGRPQSIVIERPSGRPKLDAIVLAAVKALSFPPPSPAMSERQRTFKVPYTFR